MKPDNVKILTRDNEIVTVREFFKRESEARKRLAQLPFEEKIKALIYLQTLAKTWGGKKDVIVWK